MRATADHVSDMNHRTPPTVTGFLTAVYNVAARVLVQWNGAFADKGKASGRWPWAPSR